MFRSSHIDYACQVFDEQFTEDSEGFVFRKNQTGAPIRVTPDERAGFLAQYRQHIRVSFWLFLAAMIGLVAILFWWFPDTDSSSSEAAMMIGMGAIISAFFLGYRWAWLRPSRALQGRKPEGPAFTRAEARAFALSKITYANLGLALVFGVGLILSTNEDGGFAGWELAWLVFGVGLIALAGVQALRKFLYERSHRET